jgi:hypothetical protein
MIQDRSDMTAMNLDSLTGYKIIILKRKILHKKKLELIKILAFKST